MKVFHMEFKCASAFVGFTAQFTIVWPYVCVCELMTLQVIIRRNLLGALGTLVALPFCGMVV